MSRLFKKSKKSLVILLTIAFVMSIAAVPAFAATTYSSLTAPTVPDGDYEKLGTMSIEIDPIIDDSHEAWVEVGNERGDEWDIEYVTITAAVYEGTAPGYIEIDGSPVTVGDPVPIDDSTFVISTDAGPATEDIEIWLEFTSVDVEDTGNIYAFFTNLDGQLDDGDALIGRAVAGELLLSVREYDHFSDEGNFELRVVEDTRGTFDPGDDLTLKLPRGFEWNRDIDPGSITESVVFGDVWLDNVEFSDDNREMSLYFDSDPASRSAIDLVIGDANEFAIQVADPARAEKGDVVAEVKGEYDVDPDELVVGVYGDYEYTVTPEDAETVYAGRVEQDIADIAIEEEIAGTFVLDRSVTLLLPEWAKWGSLESDYSDGDVELELRLFYGRDGREAVYRVTEADDDSPREIEFDDMEIVVSPEAPVGEDVVVSIAGSAGVRGEVVVGTVAAPATLDVDPIETIGIGRSRQDVGTITITEAEAGLWNEDKDVVLRLDEDVYWESGYEVVVDEDSGMDISSVRRTADDRHLVFRVDYESEDAPATVEVTGAVRTLRTIPEGDSFVKLRGDAIVETTDWDALTDQYDVDVDENWFYIEGNQVVRVDNVFPDQLDAAEAVLANVGVAAPPVEEPEPTEVVMWIGLTTYTVDGEAAEMDVAPFIENDRTFVPVGFIADAFGLQADWGPVEDLTEWVTFECEDMDILVEIEIGSPYITVTEEGVSRTVTADVAAQIVNDRTYLPLRAVGEIFGATFDWGPKETLTEWVSFTMMN